MFKKSERLSQSEFAHYFAIGKRVHTKYFTSITVPAPTRKVAVVVGKKVAKRAVKRNTVRRRIYAHLRTHLSQFQDITLVVVKPAYMSLSRKEAILETIHLIAQLQKGA